MTSAAILKEKRQMRERVIKALGSRRLTTAQLAAEMKLSNDDVRYALMKLRVMGQVTHDGNAKAPKWWVVEGKPLAKEIEFRPEADPQLKALVSAQWRGTWLQGMEAVL